MGQRIFACLNFRDFFYFGGFHEIKLFRIREFSFFSSSAVVEVVFASAFVLLAEFAKHKTSRILPDLQYTFVTHRTGILEHPLFFLLVKVE